MLLAQRNNVPTVVGETIFLNMRTDFRPLNALLFWAICRNSLPTEVLPVVKPTSTLADVVACTIDVLHFHGSLLRVLSAQRRVELPRRINMYKVGQYSNAGNIFCQPITDLRDGGFWTPPYLCGYSILIYYDNIIFDQMEGSHIF